MSYFFQISFTVPRGMEEIWSMYTSCSIKTCTNCSSSRSCSRIPKYMYLKNIERKSKGVQYLSSTKKTVDERKVDETIESDKDDKRRMALESDKDEQKIK